METNIQTAALACKPCRKLKRKCTRELPSCSLCTRLGKTCEYPPTAISIDDYSASRSLSERVQSLEEKIQQNQTVFPFQEGSISTDDFMIPPWTATPARTSGFPSLYLLDSKAFSKHDPDHLDPGMAAPPEVREVLSSLGIQSIYEDWFRSPYHWLPIISKKRLFREIYSFDAGSNASVALLLLSMKLLSEPPFEGEDPSKRHIYVLAQNLLCKIENAGYVSLHLLQSVLILAFFENGHGILPAGYLRVTHATRLALMMGFHDRRNSAQLFKSSETWTLREEERRTYWACIILDRYAHVGTSGVPLSTPEPGNGDLLPCPDNVWAEGEVGLNHPLFTHALSNTLKIGHSASTCQAAHLLGRVLRHRDDTLNRIDRQFRLTEALQIHRASVALDADVAQRYVASINSNSSAAITAIAIICSARLILYSMYGGNELDQPSSYEQRFPEDTEMQQNSLQGIREIIISRMALISEALMVRTDLANPMVCYSLYHAASECAWFIKENQTHEMIARMQSYVALLTAVAKRWKVGSLYLQLLEHEGAMKTLYEVTQA